MIIVTMKSRGFTLVELIAVIVITGILAAGLTVFLRPAIDSYLDARRRATLSDMADTALRRMGQDIRSAVPNSLRTTTINASPTPNCFQLVPTSTGGRYRMALDTGILAPNASAPLDTTTTTTSFDVFNPLPLTPANQPVVGDWVVINNQNGGDVYSGANRAQITKVEAPPPNPGGAAVGQYRLTIVPTQFSPGYEGGRFMVVPNAGGNQTVVYSCIGSTLFRGTAAFGASIGAACTAANRIVATQVQSCAFAYSPTAGATQQSGYMQMTLRLGNGTENVTLVHGVHVENTP